MSMMQMRICAVGCKILVMTDNLNKTCIQMNCFGSGFQMNCFGSGFGGLEVACWPLVPKLAGSHTPEAVGFLGRKNPQHAFLRRGSKAVSPMS
jgi:hypothetical protein